jgi:hypothetical protein
MGGEMTQTLYAYMNKRKKKSLDGKKESLGMKCVKMNQLINRTKHTVTSSR